MAFVSLREVAARAGVSHGAPAHHFGNKQGLLTAFAADGYRRLADAMGTARRARGPSSGPSGPLQRVGRGYVRFAVDNPEHFAIMFQVDALDAGDSDLRQAADSAYQFLREAVAGFPVKRRRRHRPEAIALAAWSMVHGLAMLWMSGRVGSRRAGPHRLAAVLCRVFAEGLLSASMSTKRR